MLTASIAYQIQSHLHEIFSTISGVATENGWKIQLKGNNYLYVIHEINEQKIVFSFSKNLSFEEYQQIHHIIISLQQHIKGTIDVSNSLLGYLPDGRGAYIITNWNKWSHFILTAKLKSLEGHKVIVYNGKGKELGNGLLLDYKLDKSPCVYECTLITTFGEQIFHGEYLVIEPTNKW
ncbi:hypothetical protein PB1_04775 [Bacillus methanolicus PB1]|uniref:Uncharacterized protein n=1 Tax=Bacillus methanolicus PB1 TaxID=997296 RepID=I3E6U8_BACMT|nr:botulinum neurotoxin N-terminal receptor binding domain-containing protein [Bacillus methanolicus]EIJ82219.1 hypothetical protein PB1_04775 [Bacillus methanolicus PB1]